MTDAQTSARALRRRAILRGGAMAGAARATGMLCSLLQVPLLLEHLGVEGFGLWATLQAAFALTGTLDLGVGYRLQNVIAEFAAKDSPHEIRPAVATVLLFTTGIAVLLVMVTLAATPAFWTSLLGVTDSELRRAVGPFLGGVLALGCASIPANLAARVASGLQRNWIVGASQAVASILSLGLVLWCVAAKASATVVLASTLAAPLGVNVVMLAIMWHGLPRGARANMHPREFVRWLRAGVPFFVPQLAAAFRTSLPPVLIAGTLGAVAVTPFTLIQRLLHFISQPQGWLLDPLWPAYTDAMCRGDWAWIKRALRLSLAGTALFVLLPVLSVLGWGPRFVEWWAGYPAASIGTGLWFWLVVLQAILVMTQPLTLCLNGLGRMRGQVVYGSITVVVGLLGMAWACGAYGLDVAAAPLALAMACINLPCAATDLRRNLQPPSIPAARAKTVTV